jgi:glutaredoxin
VYAVFTIRKCPHCAKAAAFVQSAEFIHRRGASFHALPRHCRRSLRLAIEST